MAFVTRGGSGYTLAASSAYGRTRTFALAIASYAEIFARRLKSLARVRVDRTAHSRGARSGLGILCTAKTRLLAATWPCGLSSGNTKNPRRSLWLSRSQHFFIPECFAVSHKRLEGQIKKITFYSDCDFSTVQQEVSGIGPRTDAHRLHQCCITLVSHGGAVCTVCHGGYNAKGAVNEQLHSLTGRSFDQRTSALVLINAQVRWHLSWNSTLCGTATAGTYPPWHAIRTPQHTHET